MTTVEPDAPNLAFAIISVTAFTASSLVWAMITPLPKARPSALTTVGIGAVSRYASASESSVKISYAAVGMPYFFIRFLENALLPSMIAAAAFGPKQGIPFSFRRSTQPKTNGSSGATTA